MGTRAVSSSTMSFAPALMMGKAFKDEIQKNYKVKFKSVHEFNSPTGREFSINTQAI